VRKRKLLLQENNLCRRIDSLETEFSDNTDQNESTVLNDTLDTVKTELEKLIAIQTQGAFIRARTKYQVDGEKPTKLFCSMEKHNSVQKYIPRLNVEQDGLEVVITDQKDIEKETYKYYRELFKTQDDKLDL